MGEFSRQHVSQIASIGLMLTQERAAQVLSDFERTIVADLCGRFLAAGDDMVFTPEEWRVFNDAGRAMVDVLCPAYRVEYVERGVTRAAPVSGRPH